MTAATRNSAAQHALDAARASSEVRLSVEQVSYAYSPNPVQAPLFTLEASSFQARPAEIVAVLGPNASGKSTLLKLIAGAIDPMSGRVLLNGVATNSLSPRDRAQRIAMVQQESPLPFPFRAWEFVLQGRHAYGRSLRFENDQDIAIARTPLLKSALSISPIASWTRFPGAKSSASSLSRALTQQPQLLLLDEPTLHLDIGAQVSLLETLRRLAAANRYTVVVVTHELNLAAEYSDQVVLLQKGRSLRVGPPAAVYQRELLEQVFQTSLSVELGSSGRPRVSVPGSQ